MSTPKPPTGDAAAFYHNRWEEAEAALARLREGVEQARGILAGLPAELDHIGEDGLGNRVNDAIAALLSPEADA